MSNDATDGDTSTDDGPACPHCGSSDAPHRTVQYGPRKYQFRCGDCDSPYYRIDGEIKKTLSGALQRELNRL